MGKHDDVEYKVVSKDTEGKEIVQQVFGPPNETKAKANVMRSLEAGNQASPDDALTFVRMERVTPKGVGATTGSAATDEDADNG